MTSKKLYIAISFLASYAYSATAELRAYITNAQITRQIVENLGAVYLGSYAFTDHIYTLNIETIDLDKEFIRLRAYTKTEWDQKKFCLVHKKQETYGITKKTILYQEFDTLAQAQAHTIPYHAVCSFYRTGHEYHLNTMKLYIEEIEGLAPSIEILGQQRQDIDDLLMQLPIESLVAHSVPYLVYKATR